MAWYEYESAEERKERGQKELTKLQKKGETLVALQAPQGSRKLVTTFWGKAWCQHLEKYSDYEYRLPRGRSYLRQGNVYNLNIEPGAVSANVLGSSMYEVNVKIAPLDPEAWQRIKSECAGKVGSLLDLLSGNLGAGVMTVICERDTGIFPTPKEIKLSCNCPDWADMCKHVAAVLYGVGVKFDMDAALFFRLRGVDPSELLAVGAQELLSSAEANQELAGENLSALFGIDLTGTTEAVSAAEIVPKEAPEKAPVSTELPPASTAKKRKVAAKGKARATDQKQVKEKAKRGTRSKKEK
jgi:uncharacterized Zn finger protein